MALLTLSDLHLRYRGPELLRGVSATVQRGQRIGLLGRNGAGKTSLLKILDGEVQPDSGDVVRSPGVSVGRLIQDVPRGTRGKLREIVMTAALRQNDDDRVDDPEYRWRIEHQVDRTLSQMELPADAEFATLSSGWKRRVLLASCIAAQPDVLLLDEPTNHLDIASILWLERFLLQWPGTLMFVTHDRAFLRRLATRIWEIDRGQLFDWTCDYPTFLKRKEAALAAQVKQDALFDKRLAEEEAWIRQGIKARRTRNEGRVRALHEMRKQRRDRRQVEGTAKLNLQQAESSGALVADLKDVCFGYEDRPILERFSTTIMRGDKVGIIGRNGSGKTTLLRLILGKIEPQEGQVRLGTRLQVAYFDQLRDTLDPELSVQENVGEGSDRIRIGQTTKHIIGYLQDFLFTPERARTPVKFLSGGERHRVLLAKLMTRPANVLVLDEPTNDLDSETLELLEEQLMAFEGTILLVSHDRTFINNVVTSTIVFEDMGVREYVGGYDEWQSAVARRGGDVPSVKSEKPTSSTGSGKPKTRADSTSVDNAPTSKTKKLSYGEQRELDRLPATIERLEALIEQRHTAMSDADYFRQDKEKLADEANELKQWQEELDQAYVRWDELES